jgi:hypothetical protein
MNPPKYDVVTTDEHGTATTLNHGDTGYTEARIKKYILKIRKSVVSDPIHIQKSY